MQYPAAQTRSVRVAPSPSGTAISAMGIVTQYALGPAPIELGYAPVKHRRRASLAQ